LEDGDGRENEKVSSADVSSGISAVCPGNK